MGNLMGNTFLSVTWARKKFWKHFIWQKYVVHLICLIKSRNWRNNIIIWKIRKGFQRKTKLPNIEINMITNWTSRIWGEGSWSKRSRSSRHRELHVYKIYQVNNGAIVIECKMKIMYCTIARIILHSLQLEERQLEIYQWQNNVDNQTGQIVIELGLYI